ncbi:MAG: DEAD/DEAH box helicase [Chloroflexota bacterium]|nr:DEAD/DEAH box helicase [Chloroflexota bacterium]
MSESIKSIMSRWRAQPTIAENVVEWRVVSQKPADSEPFPPLLDPALCQYLESSGIPHLYSHQAQAYKMIKDGHNVAIVSGTASGKTWCYNLPVIDNLLQQPEGKALYLFPTKALSQDQLSSLREILVRLNWPEINRANIYDGDTPQHVRSILRTESNIIITNPDMLHTGILPHHTAWKDFFTALRFIVIDEMHAYRGVFGSHVANVLRRLKRICRFYGSQPQTILTSATIANPKELAERLIEKPVSVIDQDGSPHGERHFLIYNPPLLDKKTGIRQSSLLEGTMLASELLAEEIQTIIFGRTRRTVELLLTYLRQRDKHGNPNRIRGYRSGYLRRERRAIEDGLRRGEVQGVVATSALELGIDIGGMDAAVLVGYPGSIAATRQQAGRAGRKLAPALAILVTSATAMDQYLARHPDYFFDRSPERALIAPNNLLILLQHIRCAAFELPFRDGEGFGSITAERMRAFLDLLANSGELHKQGERYFWMADQYPAADISLRNATPDQVSLVLRGDYQRQETIGQVDTNSAYWMVHPDAIYLHEGTSYLVEELDLETGTAYLKQVATDYYTQAKKDTQVEEQKRIKTAKVRGAEKALGEILVTTRVVGYRKVRWFTHESLGNGKVELPPSFLKTIGYWISIDDETVKALKDEKLWNADPNNYGPEWDLIRRRVLNRDGDQCQVCGASGAGRSLHIHHIQPFKRFPSQEAANQLQNLITLCPSCHQLAEARVRVRSGMAGFSYVLQNLAPLLIMCDGEDIDVHYDPNSTLGGGQPTVVLFDNIPGGLGLSEALYDLHDDLLVQAQETVALCECEDGCPSCVGPIGEEGSGGKAETLALLKALIRHG